MSRRRHRCRTLALLVAIAAAAAGAGAACAGWRGSDVGAGGQARDGGAAGEPEVRDPGEGPPVGLDVVRELEFPPLRFDPPEPERFELSNGVTVFFLRDAALPLIHLFVNLEGGYTYFERERYAAAAGLPSLMRNGGTLELPPDSVDALIELNALGLSTSSNGSRIVLGVTGLRRQLDLVVDLWSDILLRPRFDAEAVERWRLRELESVERIEDFPGSVAVLEFNRLMFGNHPTGWRMTPADLASERVNRARLRDLHARTVCPERAVIGAAGDVTTDELREALERAVAGWERCGNELVPPPPPDLRMDPRVYVIPKSIPQSTVVVGQPGGVLLGETEDYFASRVANWVIGGSGFTSRMVSRVRTEEGLAYSASTIWGASRRHERILGAITHTKAESTVEATRAVLDVLEDAVRNPPTRAEVELARESIVNGFVFGFSSPAQVVARQVSYLADGFPSDWLERYLRGIRDVDSASVAGVIREHVRPERFTILIVGDTARFDASVLGEVVVLPEGG